MAQRAENEAGARPASMADIAATLIGNPQPVAEAPEEEDQVTTGGDTEEDIDDTDEVVDEQDDEDEVEATSEDEGDEQEDDQSDEDANEPDYLDIRDDDLITVLVDGEEQEVSIGDLKRAHSGEGAIEKRLQEATETRKAAIAERTQALEKLAEQEQALSKVLSNLDDSVFKPVIPAPNEQLRRSNPEQYLRHKDAYEADQKRISEARAMVEGQLSELEQARNTRLQEYAQEASRTIVQEIPELADEKKAPQMFQKLANTAKSYGYTDAEIQAAMDPRMFTLVRDAMRYREMTDKTRERADPTNLEGQKAKKVRRLRTGNTQAKNRARRADQKQQKAVARARQTGKVRDVAATLLVPKG